MFVKNILNFKERLIFCVTNVYQFHKVHVNVGWYVRRRNAKPTRSASPVQSRLHDYN